MSRDYTAAQVYEWIRHRGYLPLEQYNEFGHKLPTSNMGACMEALADALKEIEQLLTAPPAKLERVWELIDAVNNDHLDKKQYRKLLDAAVVELYKWEGRHE